MLTVEGLQSFYGTAHILNGTSLHVEEGEVLALLGRNGMGKTTLVKSIARISPPQLHSGKISLAGEDVTARESFHTARLGIGYVPQGRHVFGSLTVLENLSVIARGGVNGREPWTTERVFDLFPRLAERSTARAGTLSGGEQQMLAIARALMTNPTLLLMDEPSEGLAPIVLKAIRDTLQRLKGSMTIFLVEQNVGLAVALADRINIMATQGQIVWEGTPDELTADTTATQRYLGV